LVNIILDGLIPLTFILDTGAEHTIVFEKAYTDLLGLKYDSKIKVVGSNLSEAVNALICRNVDLKVENLESVKRDILVLEENYLNIDRMVGIQLHGILGASFFQNTVLEIDYESKKIIFHHPSYYEVPDDFQALDVNIINNKPYIECEVLNNEKKSVNAKLLVDTGAAMVFMLHTNTHEEIELPEKVIVGTLGIGISGFVTGYIGKSGLLKLGDFQFNDIITNFQEIDSAFISTNKKSRDGLLGNALLARFHMIINYQNQKMYLKANKKYNREFSYDKSGMFVLAYGRKLDQFLVSGVVEGSPAYLAGIRPGDKVEKMGLIPTRIHSIKRILDKFAKEDGKVIRLKMKRGDQSYRVKFKLKDMLKTS